MFLFGIEHEVAFLHQTGYFADFLSVEYADFAAIINQLPLYQEDYPRLRVSQSGIRKKRWYIEGIDRWDEKGKRVGSMPKGIEIRTTPHQTIHGALEELNTSFRSLRVAAASSGFTPVLTSFHPYRTEFVPRPPFTAYEEAQLQRSSDERSALFAMLTYGPDLSISCHGLSAQANVDIGRKYTYYSPYIIPFSYSSPFFAGTLWEGLSVRTFFRAGRRPEARVFLDQSSTLLAEHPLLTRKARVPAEVGRIEFKSCDSCDTFAIYAGLLALLKGLLLDTTLPGRATTPDLSLHQLSARQGFADDTIAGGTQVILQAAERALENDEDVRWLDLLRAMLEARVTPAHALIDAFHAYGSIEDVLRHTY